jgi:hypothetical protein
MRPFLPDLEPPRARLVKLLDKTAFPVDPSAVASMVYQINIDPRLLIQTLCDYAITKCRPGLKRIYLVSSILSEWPFGEKFSVQDGIVRYPELREIPDDELHNLILLFSDLLERHVISYSSLVRRCIARGWTSNTVTQFSTVLTTGFQGLSEVASRASHP